MAEYNLRKLLPKLMDIDLWNDLADTLSDELTLMKTHIDKKRHFYDVVYQRDLNTTIYVKGLNSSYFENLVISGMNTYNTDNYTLYWEVTNYNDKHQINLYKDFAKTQLVLQSPTWIVNTPVSITFVEKNSSGLSGTTDFTFYAEDKARTNYIELPYENFSPLVLIANMFGFYPDLSINPDINYLEKIVYAIPLFINQKGMYSNYDIIFRLSRHLGDIFIHYWNGTGLFPAIEDYIDELETKRIGGDLGEGINLAGVRNYDSFIEGDQYLDTVPPLILDDDVMWYLDQSFARLTSKHLGIEFYIGSYVDSNINNTYNLIEKRSDVGIGDAATVAFSSLIDNMPTIPLTTLFSIYNNGTKLTSLTIALPDINYDCAITATELVSGNYNTITKTITLEFVSAPILGAVIDCSYLHCMTKEYINYLTNMSLYNKRAVEVQHIGAQLSFIMDITGYKDCILTGSAYTFPNIMTDCAVTTQFVPGASLFDNIKEIVLGDGNLSIPAVISGTPLSSNAVSHAVFSQSISNENLKQFGAEQWNSIIIAANANKIKEDINIGEADGTQTVFTGTLSHTPVRPRSVVFNYVLGGLTKSVIDRYQDPIGFYTTTLDVTASKTDLAAVDRITSFQYTLTKTGLIITTIGLTFTIGGVVYTVYDSTTDGATGVFNGNIANPGSAFISIGTIDYSSREISLTFTQATDSLTQVTFTYSYTQDEVVSLDEQAYAVINYDTGEYTLNCFYDKEKTDVISTTAINSIVNYGVGISSSAELQPTTLELSFYLSDGSHLTAKDVQTIGDPTTGYFEATTNIASSSINYTTKVINVTFNDYTSYFENVELTYTYRTLNPPDNGTNIEVEYITEKNIKITEVGIMDISDNMIAYATFPPIELDDAKLHTSYQFFIYYGGAFNT